jgi:hypothetical protein
VTCRCPSCRTRRATYQSLQAHIRESGHKACTCGGYHYPHRPFSRFCDQNPMSDVHVAARNGEPREVLDEIALEVAWSRPLRPLKVWIW